MAEEEPVSANGTIEHVDAPTSLAEAPAKKPRKPHKPHSYKFPPGLMPADADPIIAERFKLAALCTPKQRVAVEIYVDTRNKKKAILDAGYEVAQYDKAWAKLMSKPQVADYYVFLESRKAAEPDRFWCLHELVKITREPRAAASARVAAIKAVGAIKDVHGLSETATTNVNVVVPTKVIIGVDPEKI